MHADVCKAQRTLNTILCVPAAFMSGIARKSLVVSPEVLKKTAYHEGGHTLVALLTNHAAPLYKTTILPRGHTGGAVRTTSLARTD